MIVKVLPGHTSPETAYLVEDYPYGFKLRTEKRYWIEEHPKKGFRLGTQTRTPKLASRPWNKVSYSTYSAFGGGLFLDENEHVQWTGVTEYTDAEEILAFAKTFGSTPTLKMVIKAKLSLYKRFQAAHARGDSGYTTNGQPVPLKPSDVEKNEASIAKLEEILRNWPA